MNLEFSCPERLDAMQPTSGGFNCAKCSRKVIDFREKSIAEIQEYIAQSFDATGEANSGEARPCGVFKRSQMSKQFLRYAAATVIASAAAIPLNAQTTQLDTVALEMTIDSLEVEEEEEIDIVFGSIIEIQAEPIGGYQKFYETLAKTVKNPPKLTEKGKVFIQFTVDTLGRMQDLKVLKGFHKEADKAAMEALQKLNYPFQPGQQRGKKIETRMVLPVFFDPQNRD